MHSTPPAPLGAIVWLVFRVPKERRIFRAKNARFRCLERPAECSFWNPSGSDRRDPNTLAPNGIKLGRLRYARQGLVRVPESNTKYGGKPGKTGAPPSRCWGASISESSGIPKRKNSAFPGHFRPCPAVHRADIYYGLCPCFRPTQRPAAVRHAVLSMVWCREKRQGGMLISSFCLSMISAQTRFRVCQLRETGFHFSGSCSGGPDPS